MRAAPLLSNRLGYPLAPPSRRGWPWTEFDLFEELLPRTRPSSPLARAGARFPGLPLPAPTAPSKAPVAPSPTLSPPQGEQPSWWPPGPTPWLRGRPPAVGEPFVPPEAFGGKEPTPAPGLSSADIAWALDALGDPALRERLSGAAKQGLSMLGNLAARTSPLSYVESPIGPIAPLATGLAATVLQPGPSAEVVMPALGRALYAPVEGLAHRALQEAALLPARAVLAQRYLDRALRNLASDIYYYTVTEPNFERQIEEDKEYIRKQWAPRIQLAEENTQVFRNLREQEEARTRRAEELGEKAAEALQNPAREAAYNWGKIGPRLWFPPYNPQPPDTTVGYPVRMPDGSVKLLPLTNVPIDMRPVWQRMYDAERERGEDLMPDYVDPRQRWLKHQEYMEQKKELAKPAASPEERRYMATMKAQGRPPLLPVARAEMGRGGMSLESIASIFGPRTAAEVARLQGLQASERMQQRWIQQQQEWAREQEAQRRFEERNRQRPLTDPRLATLTVLQNGMQSTAEWLRSMEPVATQVMQKKEKDRTDQDKALLDIYGRTQTQLANLNNTISQLSAEIASGNQAPSGEVPAVPTPLGVPGRAPTAPVPAEPPALPVPGQGPGATAIPAPAQVLPPPGAAAEGPISWPSASAPKPGADVPRYVSTLLNKLYYEAKSQAGLEQYDIPTREVEENFRQRAAQAGVPPEHVEGYLKSLPPPLEAVTQQFLNEKGVTLESITPLQLRMLQERLDQNEAGLLFTSMYKSSLINRIAEAKAKKYLDKAARSGGKLPQSEIKELESILKEIGLPPIKIKDYTVRIGDKPLPDLPFAPFY